MPESDARSVGLFRTRWSESVRKGGFKAAINFVSHFGCKSNEMFCKCLHQEQVRSFTGDVLLFLG